MMAKDFVERYYSKILDVPNFHGNQLECQSIVARQVANALNGGEFLENGVDAEVSIFQSSDHIAEPHQYHRVALITSRTLALRTSAFPSSTPETML